MTGMIVHVSQLRKFGYYPLRKRDTDHGLQQASQYIRGRAMKDIVALFDVLAKETRLKLRKNNDLRNQ